MIYQLQNVRMPSIEMMRTDLNFEDVFTHSKKKEYESQDMVNDFGKLFTNALSNVNNAQINSMKLSQQMITDPESVNVHQVTTAVAEANLSLAMTKAIVDGAVRAYREVINLR